MRWNDDRMEDAVKGNSSIRLFGSAMREAVDQLSQAVLGKPWDERYRPPGAYTGKTCYHLLFWDLSIWLLMSQQY